MASAVEECAAVAVVKAVGGEGGAGLGGGGHCGEGQGMVLQLPRAPPRPPVQPHRLSSELRPTRQMMPARNVRQKQLQWVRRRRAGLAGGRVDVEWGGKRERGCGKKGEASRGGS